MTWSLRIISYKSGRGIQFLSGSQVFQSQTKTKNPQMKTMRYHQHMETMMMMTSLKMKKREESSKKRHMTKGIKMNIHQTGEID